MMDRLAQKHGPEGLTGRCRRLFVMRGEPKSRLLEMLNQPNLGAAASGYIKHNIEALLASGCQVRVSEHKPDLLDFRMLVAKKEIEVAVDASWIIYDDRRIDASRVTSYGEFHDVHIFCEGMPTFVGLQELLRAYFEGMWEKAAEWNAFWP